MLYRHTKTHTGKLIYKLMYSSGILLGSEIVGAPKKVKTSVVIVK